MSREVLEYLKTQRVGVLAVEMLDGSPHGATVHFAHTEDPFVFYFETRRGYRKAEPLLKNKNTRATFVVGVNDADKKTLQIDGVARVLDDEKIESFEEVYFAKFPDKRVKYEKENFLIFCLEPTWWRFTDWTAPGGKLILISDSI